MRKLLVSAISFFILVSCVKKPSENEMAAKAFLDSLTSIVEPLYTKMSQSYWDATATGEDKCYDCYAELNIEMKKIFSNPADFQRVKEFREKGKISDPVLARSVEVTYYDFLSNQADTSLLRKITEVETRVEKKFNTFRGEIDGKKITGNDIKDILKNCDDSIKRKKAWEASKQVGPEVESDMLELVKLRNESARAMGFDNFYQLKLIAREQDPEELVKIFDELDQVTSEPFIKAKTEMDEVLAARFNVKPGELKPWHYADPFFQDAPVITEVKLDPYYAEQDVVELASQFYKGIGFDVKPILDRSDLYEREKKYPHAYCTNIDKKGDVRIMVNVRPTESWMATTLHELGHAIYDLYIDSELPYVLKDPAHIFTTEAVAMFFERLSKNAEWMQQMIGISDEDKEKIEEVTVKTLRLEQLIFARWTQVMLHFERSLYENPDQNLNKLWWDLVEKYQMVKRPEGRDMPDWATKIHICSVPIYYHNYMLGGMLASQFLFAIAKSQDLGSIDEIRFVENPEIGTYLIENVFKHGKKYRWDEMVVGATGEKLTAKYFVQQFAQP